MSTNATIAVKTPEGYEGIYVHWDGYPSYMYPLLRDWYDNIERATSLVGFGDASFLDKRLTPSVDSNHSFDNPEDGVCIFYNRDRGEDFNAAFYGNKKALLRSERYVYIFEDDSWHVYIDGQEADDYSNFD
jgi:hypothetical protein